MQMQLVYVKKKKNELKEKIQDHKSFGRIRQSIILFEDSTFYSVWTVDMMFKRFHWGVCETVTCHK